MKRSSTGSAERWRRRLHWSPTGPPCCNGGRRRDDIHQTTAWRRASRELASYGGKVHSGKGQVRSCILSWTPASSWKAQVMVSAATWRCALAGLVAAVATYQVDSAPRERAGVEL